MKRFVRGQWVGPLSIVLHRYRAVIRKTLKPDQLDDLLGGLKQGQNRAEQAIRKSSALVLVIFWLVLDSKEGSISIKMPMWGELNIPVHILVLIGVSGLYQLVQSSIQRFYLPQIKREAIKVLGATDDFIVEEVVRSGEDMDASVFVHDSKFFRRPGLIWRLVQLKVVSIFLVIGMLFLWAMDLFIRSAFQSILSFDAVQMTSGMLALILCLNVVLLILFALLPAKVEKDVFRVRWMFLWPLHRRLYGKPHPLGDKWLE